MIEVFYCRGVSEENTEVVTKIKEYKAKKDYIYTSNQSSGNFLHYLDNKLDKYEILNSQLKEEVGKICQEYSKNDDAHLEKHRKAMEEHRKHMEEHRRMVEEARKVRKEKNKINLAVREKESPRPEKTYPILEKDLPELKKWS